MRIFITGASGKIGKNLSNYLINKNYFCILNTRRKVKIKGKKKDFCNYKKDILAKSTGSNNKINVAKAVVEGLKTLRDPIMVAKQRGITVKELFS